MKSKVAIVGMANGYEQAPYDDDSYELWGINDLYLRLDDHQVSRFSRWFELHGDTPLTRGRREADHWDRLATLGLPTYCFHPLPTVPTAIAFPIERAIATGRRDYFACTNAYQIALALSEGMTTIELYGTPLLGSRESIVERPCVEWWLGLAEGRGVRVRIVHPYEAGLGRQKFRYADEDYDERLMTYQTVLGVAADSARWIPQEAERLNVSEDLESVEMVHGA